MHPKNAEGIANSVDPDLTAPLGAVCSGSTLFAQTCLSENFGTLRVHVYSWISDKGKGRERSELAKEKGRERSELVKGKGRERSELAKGKGWERSELVKGKGRERSELAKGKGWERSELVKGKGPN